MILDDGPNERDEEQRKSQGDANSKRFIASDGAEDLINKHGLQGAEDELCGLEAGGEEHAEAVVAEECGEET